MSLRSLVPWYARIGAKLMLSRLPAAYSMWRRLGCFSHGAMDRPDYGHRIFKQRDDAADPDAVLAACGTHSGTDGLRALQPSGLCSHTVGLRDHLGGGLISMRLDSPQRPRHRLTPEFRGLPDDDLLVREFDVLLRPA